MEIAFDLEISEEVKYSTMWDINRKKIEFEQFFKNINLELQENPFEYKIIIKDKILGFITEGMVDPETKSIFFYGLEDINLIIHEWTHIGFPNFKCERHSEGLAIYIQMQLGKFHLHGFEAPIDLVTSYLYSRNREKVKNWLKFLKDPNNFFDSRLGRMLISRSLSAEFVTFLINKYGLKDYLKEFYYKIRSNNDNNWLEDVEFSNFLENIPSSSELVLEPFLDLKNSFIQKYSKHFIPKSGSVLSYLITNKDKIDPMEYTYLQNVALEDLRTTLYFYS